MTSPAEPAPGRYWSGFFTGVTFVLMVLTLAFAAEVVPGLRGMYGDLGGGRAELPALTRVVLTPIWAWGAPMVTLAGAGLVNHTLRSSRQQPLALGVVTLLALGVAIASVVGAYAPLWDVTGKIH